jgi:hypothetical protein
MVRGATAAFAMTLLVALAVRADDGRPRFYRWTDAQGVVHYANDPSLVPEPFRSHATVTVPPRAGPTTSAPPAANGPASEPPGVASGAPTGAVLPLPTAPHLGLEEIAPEDGPEVVRLKRQIAADRERIKVLLSEPGVDGPKLAASPALAEIAARLARHQAELAALRQELTP